jgi:hypothetical protein
VFISEHTLISTPTKVFVKGAGAALGALLLSPMRSLPFCLVGGLTGYAVRVVY